MIDKVLNVNGIGVTHAALPNPHATSTDWHDKAMDEYALIIRERTKQSSRNLIINSLNDTGWL